MSLVDSVKAEFQKSPLLAASAVAAVVGAVVLVTRHGTAGTALASPLDSAANPQANLAGGGGSGGGGGAGLGQGDPTVGVPTANVPTQSGTSTAPILSASDVAAAINQAVAGLSSTISDSQSQLQGEINQLATAVSRSQTVSEVPRAPAPLGQSQDPGLIEQLLNRLSNLAVPVGEIAPPTPTATPDIVAPPRSISPTLASDGQSLFSQSPDTIAAFQATFGAGAAAAWVTQHEQELLHPKPQVLPAFSQAPAPPSPPPAPLIADPTGGLISNPIPGVDSGSFIKPQAAVAFGVPLPQPQNPLANVDYGPPSLPAVNLVPPAGSQAAANEAAFASALQTQNPVRQQAAQPRPADAPTSENAPARAQTTHVRLE